MGDGVNPEQVGTKLWRTVKKTVYLYGHHDTGHRAAALAFYTLLSIFPLILLLTALVGRWLATPEAPTTVFLLLQRVIPIVPDVFEENIRYVLTLRGTINWVAGISLAWSSSSLFAAIITSVDRVWNQRSGRTFWEHRLLALGLVIAVILLFLVSLLASALLAQIPRLIVMLVPIQPEILQSGWRYGPHILSFALDMLLYALLYRFLPSRYPPWCAVWPGAVVAGLGWNGLKYGFGWYLAHFARYGLVYGTLATLIAFLFWVYFSGLVLLVGAEFGAAWEEVWCGGESAGGELGPPARESVPCAQ